MPHAGAVAVATVAEADAALQQRITREGYIFGAFGVGAVMGQALDGKRGSFVGGIAAGAWAYYRSRPPRD